MAIEGNGYGPSHKGDGYSVSDISYTLNHVEQHGVCYAADIRNGTIRDEVNGTLQAKSSGGWNANSNAWKSGNPHSGVYEAETARSLDRMQCGNPSCHQGGMVVVEQK